jgi:hypothetical protein
MYMIEILKYPVVPVHPVCFFCLHYFPKYPAKMEAEFLTWIIHECS